MKPAWINHQSPPHFFIPKIESLVVLPIIKFCTISKISKTTQIDYLSVCPCPLSCLRILLTFFSSCWSYFTGNTIPLHGSVSSFFFSLYLWLPLLFLLTAWLDEVLFYFYLSEDRSTELERYLLDELLLRSRRGYWISFSWFSFRVISIAFLVVYIPRRIRVIRSAICM